MTERVKTSIYIDRELWEKLKAYARSRNMEVSRLLEELVKENLDSEIVDILGELVGEGFVELDFEPVKAKGLVSGLVREIRDERAAGLS